MQDVEIIAKKLKYFNFRLLPSPTCQSYASELNAPRYLVPSFLDVAYYSNLFLETLKPREYFS